MDMMERNGKLALANYLQTHSGLGVFFFNAFKNWEFLRTVLLHFGSPLNHIPS
jgi:hypothetical protein